MNFINLQKFKYLLTTISLSCFCISTIGYSQTFTVKGKILTSSEPVKFAKITFIDQNDTTRKFTTITDTAGNYRLDIITSVKLHENLPSKFELEQNYPNPFSTQTAIPYKLKKQLNISIKIYNILGQLVKEFNIGTQLAGLHGIIWDGKNNMGQQVAPGVYFYQLQTSNSAIVKKMVFTGGLSGSTASSLKEIYSQNLSLNKNKLFKSTSTSYEISIKNTNITEPTIDPFEKYGIKIVHDTTINIEVQQAIKLFVIEKDHLFGGFGGVDMYHEMLIINTTKDSISFNVQSPLPDTLKHTSQRSPAFGMDAIIPTPYQDYFDLPSINNSFYTNKPDSSTDTSYFWKNLKLGPSDLMEVPYSNYYGNDGSIFVKNFGVSQFLYLDIVSNYSIKRDTVEPNYIDIQIKETLHNITNDTLYRIGTHLFVPRELITDNDPYTLDSTKYYNLISDTIISDNKLYLFNNTYTSDGFGFGSGGQEMETGWFFLLPYQSFEFVFRMTIEPLFDKFEIYPSYGVTYIKPGGNRIWPASIITINDRKYNGQVHYLKEVGLVLPTYILFSINKDTLRVVSPNDVVPTL